jgi:hypothetical protein
MRRVLSLAIVAGVILLCGGGQVKADPVYDVSGTFGGDAVGTTGLAGGSFTVTYEVGGLPVGPGTAVSFDSDSVSLYNSTHSLVYRFGSTGSNNSFLANIGGFLQLANFFDPNSTADLTLTFTPSFAGTGSVIPTSQGFFGLNSIYGDPDGNEVSIVSGQSVAVPEPSSLIVAMTGSALLCGGLIVRRRKADQ